MDMSQNHFTYQRLRLMNTNPHVRTKLQRKKFDKITNKSVKEAEELTKQLEEAWVQEEIVIQRRQRNKILRLKDEGGVWLEEREEINCTFDAYYRKLFHSVGSRPMEQALAYVDRVVTDEENSNLKRPVSNLEIEEAVFQLGANKALGPDGYTALFYQSAWKEVANEVCGMVKDFFEDRA
ncbi:hypothetical protein K1719_040659 [Acacia pycnantha]|nr:hypothetical protein K1719_040659 [Acacia pycnantha]